MATNYFIITRVEDVILIQKNNISIKIYQKSDNDIFFQTTSGDALIDLSSSGNRAEFQIYKAFEALMKSMIGRYILNDYNNLNHSPLPNDFIDLSNKTITWHSDGSTDDVLTLTYHYNTISLSLAKSRVTKNSNNSTVRIRTNGSDYGNYYVEFLEFYRKLLGSAPELSIQEEIQNSQMELAIQKGLSLFNRWKRK